MAIEDPLESQQMGIPGRLMCIRARMCRPGTIGHDSLAGCRHDNCGQCSMPRAVQLYAPYTLPPPKAHPCP